MGKPTDPLGTPQPAQHTFDAHFATPPARDRLPPQHQPQHQPPSGGSVAPMAAPDAHGPVQAYAKLEGPDFCYYVRTLEVSLGRHSSSDGRAGTVDIDLGDSKAVSRCHAKIHYSFATQCFELQVFGKNGCLIDDEYHAKGQSIPLRHKMVIQIGDTEFTFLLPKAAVPAPGGYTADAASPRRGKMPAADAHPDAPHYAYPPHPPPAAAPLPPPQAGAPPLAGYPVSAITPQRLNLYPHAPPAYAQAKHSPGSLRGTPPAPLSFGDARRDGPYAAPISDAAPRSDSHGSQPPPQSSRPAAAGPFNPQRSPPHQRGAGPAGAARSAQPPPPARQGPPQGLLPGQGASGSAGEVRILPSTERPASHDGQNPGSFAKPSFSYASLIAQAINSTAEAKVTLNGIYTYIMANYPYYKHAQNGWQNSIRHNLSLNKAFIRVQRASNEPGKGSYWAIDDAYKGQFSNGVYKRTRRTKKAMELDRERERERALQRVVAVTTAVPVVAATPTRPRRGPPPNGAHAQAPRSMAGEKRQSPEGDDDDDDDYGEGGLNDAARALAVGHPPKRASVGAQSTGDDTVDYMSSALSVNDESRADSLQDSPTSHVTPRSSDEDRGDNPEREPPAAGTRSKTGSAARPGPGACATPASVALPSSSRPSQPRPQPRPQRSVAR